MRMQEPEQWQFSEEVGATSQDYGASRSEAGQNALEQNIYAQQTRQSRGSVLNILIIVFSSIGFGPSIVGLVGSILVLTNRTGSQYLLTGGILGLVGSSVALLLFVTVFVLSLVSAARRGMSYQGSRYR